MMPLLMTTMMTLVPPQERGKVMGNVTLVMSVAPALGPAVSGLLLQLGSWRLIFAIVLPIAGVVGTLGLRELVNIGEHHQHPDRPAQRRSCPRSDSAPWSTGSAAWVKAPARPTPSLRPW